MQLSRLVSKGGLVRTYTPLVPYPACPCPPCSPIFYMRKKVQKDLRDSAEELVRFDVNW